MRSLNKTASWVIVDKITNKSIVEIYNPDLITKVNTQKYKVIPILEYLQSLNKNYNDNTKY